MITYWQLALLLSLSPITISTSSVHSILAENLLTRKVYMQDGVPRMLLWRSERQICLIHQSVCQHNENVDNFISWLLTVDETRLHRYEPESKIQSIFWKQATSTPPKISYRILRLETLPHSPTPPPSVTARHRVVKFHEMSLSDGPMKGKYSDKMRALRRGKKCSQPVHDQSLTTESRTNGQTELA